MNTKKIQKFATYIGSILTLQPAFVILNSSYPKYDWTCILDIW